jgi:hypothetical protein
MSIPGICPDALILAADCMQSKARPACHARSCVVQRPVSKILVPDYNKFVDPKEEIHLEAIEKKLKAGKYSSAAEFQQDVSQIVRNAAAYNSRGHGQYGAPGVALCTSFLKHSIALPHYHAASRATRTS